MSLLPDPVRRTWVAARLKPRYGINLVYALGGLVAGVITFSLQLTWATVIAALGLAFAVVRLAWGWRDAVAPGATVKLEDRAGSLPREYESPYDAWEVLSWGSAEVIHSPALDQRLAAADRIRIDVRDGDWRPETEPSREYAKIWPLGKNVRNEQKIRLCTDLTHDSSSVTLQRTDYASYLFTHHLAKKDVYRNGVGPLRLEDVALRGGRLRRLSQSQASNQLGGDLLAIAPGECYLSVNGPANLVNRDRHVASASGSFDWPDLAGHDHLVSIVKVGLRRELEEESGVPAALLPDLDDIRVTGFSRATYMGGKPQFYGVARLAERFSPKVRRSEREYVTRPYTASFDDQVGLADLIRVLRELREDKASVLSEALVFSIEMLAQWHEHDPEGTDAWMFRRD